MPSSSSNHHHVVERVVELPKTQTAAHIAQQPSRVAVIVTHPWGPLGGNMHNNVVVAVTLYFQKLGITTARFDFHGGIGRGYAQVDQVVEVAEYLWSNSGAAKILLVGYSYGSLIAASASADIGPEKCLACISIAPPFSVSHWLLLFNSQYHLKQASSLPNLPRLFLIGTNDNFTTEAVFKETVQSNFPVGSDKTTGAVIKGADHFFRRREKDVMDVIGQWLQETFAAQLKDGQDLRNLRNLQF